MREIKIIYIYTYEMKQYTRDPSWILVTYVP